MKKTHRVQAHNLSHEALDFVAKLAKRRKLSASRALDLLILDAKRRRITLAA